MNIVYTVTVNVFRVDGENLDQTHPDFLKIKENYERAISGQEQNRILQNHHLEVVSVVEAE